MYFLFREKSERTRERKKNSTVLASLRSFFSSSSLSSFTSSFLQTSKNTMATVARSAACTGVARFAAPGERERERESERERERVFNEKRLLAKRFFFSLFASDPNRSGGKVDRAWDLFLVFFSHSLHLSRQSPRNAPSWHRNRNGMLTA